MNVEHKEFPSDLRIKLSSRVNKPIKVQFYGGSNINTDIFNISLVEPFKVVFTRKNNHIVVFIITKENDIIRTSESEVYLWVYNLRLIQESLKEILKSKLTKLLKNNKLRLMP